MKTNKVLSLFLSVVMLLSVLPLGVLAETAASDFTYTITDGEVTITGYTGAGGEVTIPSEIEGFPVVAIAKHAFEFCDTLTSVTIPASITIIGYSAFYQCNHLKTIYCHAKQSSDGWDESWTNGFYGNVYLDGKIYRGIVGDWRVAIDDGEVKIVYYIGDGKNVEIPSHIDGYPVTAIGWGAFEELYHVKSITIPNTVKTIDDYAFSGTEVREVVIPDSVTSIGNCAFGWCNSLTDIYCEAEVQPTGWDYGWLEECYATVHWSVSSGESDTSDFSYEITDGKVTITGYIGEGGDVVIPKEIEGYPVTRIGESAFAYCDSLASITIHDGVTTIEAYTFSDCSSLTEVTIPDSVTDIREYAFYHCSSLENIMIPSNMTSIWHFAFAGCSSLINISIPNSVTYIGNDAFSGCSDLTSITIPENVTTIGSGAFSRCNAVISISVNENNTIYYSEGNCIIEKATNRLIQGCNVSTIPDDVTSIGDSAFAGCRSLTSITIPESVTGIGGGAFSECVSLTSVTIPNNVTGIAYRSFAWCTSLTSITIPDGVTHIGHYAFEGCSSLTFITIPESVTNVEMCVFRYCNSMTDIYCEVESQPEVWDASWLEECYATVHWGVKPPVTHGDATGDGTIDGTDVTRLLRYLASYDDDTGISEVEIGEGADCNGDGVINGKDVVRLLRYLASYDDETGTSDVELG